jgi:hypothetical protein
MRRCQLQLIAKAGTTYLSVYNATTGEVFSNTLIFKVAESSQTDEGLPALPGQEMKKAMCQLLAASFLTPLRPALPADAALDHPVRHLSIQVTRESKTHRK